MIIIVINIMGTHICQTLSLPLTHSFNIYNTTHSALHTPPPPAGLNLYHRPVASLLPIISHGDRPSHPQEGGAGVKPVIIIMIIIK